MLRCDWVRLTRGSDFIGRLLALAELLKHAQRRSRHDRASITKCNLSIDKRERCQIEQERHALHHAFGLRAELHGALHTHNRPERS